MSGEFQRVVYIIIPENDVLPDPICKHLKSVKRL